MNIRLAAILFACFVACLTLTLNAQDHELEGAALFERADVRPYDNWAAQATKPAESKAEASQQFLLRYKFHLLLVGLAVAAGLLGKSLPTPIHCTHRSYPGGRGGKAATMPDASATHVRADTARL